MIRVDELIEILRGMDPKAPVMLQNDGDLYDLDYVQQIDPEEARTGKFHKHTVTLG